MKSKPTIYNGYHFRSRLEARWAIFFESLGIKYHYEYQDFILPSGNRYLPDFYLPNFEGGCYAEVKQEFDQQSIEKCKELASIANKCVVLLEGPPDFKCSNLISIYVEEMNEDSNRLTRVLFCADQAAGENRFFVEPGYEKEDLTIPDDYLDCLGKTYIDAVHASRSARFEFL